MREVSQDLLDEIDYDRVFDARLKIYNERLYFTEMDQRVIDAQISEDMYAYDASTHSNGILRVASVDVTGSTYLFTQWLPDPSGTWPNWVNQNIEIGKYSKPGVVGNRIIYLKKTGPDTARIEWADYNTSTGALDSTTYISKSMDPDQPTAISPINSDEFYVHTNKFEPDVSEVNYGYVSYFVYAGPGASDYTERQWPGSIYGDNQHTHYFDVGRLDGLDYIHLTDFNEKRGIYLTAIAGEGWSDTTQVYPLDAVDDTSLFRPGFVTVLNDRLFATGILKRTSGMAMQIYTIGPEHFTAGREMFIGTRGTDEISLYYESAYYTCPATGGKLHVANSKLYYLGPGIAYQSEAKSVVGVATTPVEYAINNATLTQERTGSGTASMEIYQPEAGTSMAPTDYLLTNRYFPAIYWPEKYFPIAGSTLAERPSTGLIAELEVAYSDEWVKLAAIDIDSAPKQLTEDGASIGIVGRPKSIKSLTQWQSDASYDYWSQAKQANCPTTREENVISMGMGHWAEDGDNAYIDAPNEHGIMYAVARPSNGMLVKGKFLHPTAFRFLSQIRPHHALLHRNQSRDRRPAWG